MRVEAGRAALRPDYFSAALCPTQTYEKYEKTNSSEAIISLQRALFIALFSILLPSRLVALDLDLVRVGGCHTSKYGYFTHVAGVENVFGGTPNNASTAFFTFTNKLSTTRATPHGPLTVVDRKGTTTIYLNPVAGASFANPASFETGTPVLTASLRHQVILDTLSGNTIFMQFDLTVMSAEKGEGRFSSIA